MICFRYIVDGWRAVAVYAFRRSNLGLMELRRRDTRMDGVLDFTPKVFAMLLHDGWTTEMSAASKAATSAAGTWARIMNEILHNSSSFTIV